jgi:hypothetical protein
MGLRLIGILAVIPTTMLLAISFFILFTIKKTEDKGLKTFGYVITALLWCCAVVVFSFGIYTLATGCHPLGLMKHGMKMEQMRHPMMPEMRPEGMMPERMPPHLMPPGMMKEKAE